MGRIAYLPFTATVTAAGGDADLVEITAADDKPVKVCGWLIGQHTDLGDAQSEGVRLSLIRLPATFTSSNGSAITAQTPDSADAAPGLASEANGATIATTSGTAQILMEIPFPLQASPWEFWFPEDRFRPKIKQGEGLVLRVQTTLADDATFEGTIFVEEE